MMRLVRLLFILSLILQSYLAYGSGGIEVEDSHLEGETLAWSLNPVLSDPSQTPRKSKVFKVLIDPGHGGKDSGTVTKFLHEKTVALEFAYLIKSQLENSKQIPFSVSLTREQDEYVSLAERVRKANESGIDFFLSLHVNSYQDESASGFEIYYYSDKGSDAAADRLAKKENQNMPKDLDSKIGKIVAGIQKNFRNEQSAHFAANLFSHMKKVASSNGKGVKQAPFYVLQETKMPSLLLELGYITNPSDFKLFLKSDYLNNLANAISKGIESSLNPKFIAKGW